jgi:hypothetical protein
MNAVSMSSPTSRVLGDLDISYPTLLRYLHENNYARRIPRPIPEPPDKKSGKSGGKNFIKNYSNSPKIRT